MPPCGPLRPGGAAILNLDDATTQGIDFQTMNVVIAPIDVVILPVYAREVFGSAVTLGFMTAALAGGGLTVIATHDEIAVADLATLTLGAAVTGLRAAAHLLGAVH